MPTIRKVCSDMVNELNSKNLDNRLSYRYLSSSLIDAATTVLNQDADYRRLFSISKLWQRITCIPMKEVNFVECSFDISGCTTIQKSEIQLPSFYTTKYGDVLKVNNIKYGKEYRQIKPEEYKAYKDRRFKLKTFGYYWIIDNYIYIPDSYVEEITVRGMFKYDTEVKKLNKEYGADCLSPLDSNFEFPDYIISLAKQNVLQSGRITKSIPVDDNPNLSNKS
jgi:hypothetical protein